MPTMKTVYRSYKGKDDNGKMVDMVDAVQMPSVDANECCRRHPKEWSFTNPDAKAAAKAEAEAKAKADGDANKSAANNLSIVTGGGSDAG